MKQSCLWVIRMILTLRPVLVFLLVSCCSSLQAADIAREVRHGRLSTEGFIELGLALGVAKLPIAGAAPDEDDPEAVGPLIGISLNAAGSWRGLFAEAIYGSFGGLAAGYHLFESDETSIDFFVTNTFGELEPMQPQFAAVEPRSADIVAGLRSSLYLPNSILQFSILSDISDTHSGSWASARWGKNWQLRNWNVHGLVGLGYFSSDLLDYYFGIESAEANDRVPVYTAGDGVLSELEIGVTRALNEEWLLRGSAQWIGFPDALSDSPLVFDDHGYSADLSLMYVF